MADHRHNHHDELPDVSHISNPDVAHEESDVSTGGIRSFGIWFAVSLAVSMLLMYGFVKLLLKDAADNEPKVSTLVQQSEKQLPPEPRLQLAPGHAAHPLDDWAAFKAYEDSVSYNYYWVDKSNGVAHIPIYRAKQLLMQKGLPSRQVSADQATREQGVLIPSEFSSGTTLHWRDQ